MPPKLSLAVEQSSAVMALGAQEMVVVFVCLEMCFGTERFVGSTDLLVSTCKRTGSCLGPTLKQRGGI